MKADPFAQLKLLDVQELDSRLDTLAHQLRTLPEHEQLAAAEARRQTARDRVRDLQVTVSDLTAEQRRADADVEQVKTRQQRDQGLVDAGSVNDPKALERMLGELESLRRRISDLEDVELEVMERLETAQADLADAEREVEAADAEVTTVGAARAEKGAGLTGERNDVQRERDQAASGLPEDLMALYTRLREQKGGVGAAALRAKQCGGCRLTLDASILGDIARTPVDEVVRCEECGRILVRTGESGLG